VAAQGPEDAGCIAVNKIFVEPEPHTSVAAAAEREVFPQLAGH
jgi:hypothetical protein